MRKKPLLAIFLQAIAAAGIGSVASRAQVASDSVADQGALRRAETLVNQMTLDEKLQFIVSKYPNNADPGGGAGYVAGIPRLNIPDINISDSATGSGSSKQPQV